MRRKELLREENGTIRNCPSNIAKMNIFQIMYIDKFGLDYVNWEDFFIDLGFVLFIVILILFLPITLVVFAYFRKIAAKRLVEEEEK